MATRHTLPLIVGTVAGMMFYLPSLPVMAPFFGRFGEALPVAAASWLQMVGALILPLAVVGAYRARRQPFGRFAMWIAGFALVEALVQALVTHHSFYGRSYLYLIPFLCILAGLLWRKQ